MKKLLVVAVVLVAALVGWNYHTTGEVRLMPEFAASSPEEARIDDLEDRFDESMRTWARAQRGTGLAGIDMTADADLAVRELARVRNELERMIPSLEDESLASRARELLQRIIASERRMT